LRERRDDILWLAKKFLDEQSAKSGGVPFSFTTAAERILLSHPWPGNVRELKHCIERACILGDHPQLGPEALLGDTPLHAAVGASSASSLGSHLDACEKHYIEQLLAAHTWRIGETAESLGISRKNLWEKMRKHDIAEPAKRTSP
jgi:DNA-binding NtrC family response regulator